MPVDVVHFNPLRRASGWRKYVLPRKPLNNFGDLIGPILVAHIEQQLKLTQPDEHRRVLAVGSIMKLSRPGDVVWGAGVNGKSMDVGGAPHLDVRAVRGPRTRDLLIKSGVQVPAIYGDPALLWSSFWPREHYLSGDNSGSRGAISVVPNFHDRGTMKGPSVIDPLDDVFSVVRRIAQSDFVCGSSLHGIVIAESFGIPARLVTPGAEPAFKYDDYYAGTGREDYRTASTVEMAIKMGGEAAPIWSKEKLLEAFPTDIYKSAVSKAPTTRSANPSDRAAGDK